MSVSVVQVIRVHRRRSDRAGPAVRADARGLAAGDIDLAIRRGRGADCRPRRPAIETIERFEEAALDGRNAVWHTVRKERNDRNDPRLHQAAPPQRFPLHRNRALPFLGLSGIEGAEPPASPIVIALYDNGYVVHDTVGIMSQCSLCSDLPPTVSSSPPGSSSSLFWISWCSRSRLMPSSWATRSVSSRA